jgi:beta-lactamase superfamily II metal-dependent hydrolase
MVTVMVLTCADADHINDIKEAMKGITLPNAPTWAQV